MAVVYCSISIRSIEVSRLPGSNPGAASASSNLLRGALAIFDFSQFSFIIPFFFKKKIRESDKFL